MVAAVGDWSADGRGGVGRRGSQRLDHARVEASDLADPQDDKALTRIRLVLRAVGPRMLIHNLRTVNAINAAREAGVTYGALDIAGLGGHA